MVRSWSSCWRGRHAALDQRLPALEFGLCGGKLRVQGVDLRVVRGNLEDELLVVDRGDPLAGGHRVALGDEKFLDDAADARPRRHVVPRCDGAEDRLPLGDRLGRERQRAGRNRGGRQEECGKERDAHGCRLRRRSPAESRACGRPRRRGRGR